MEEVRSWMTSQAGGAQAERGASGDRTAAEEVIAVGASRSIPVGKPLRREPAFLWLFFGKVVLLMVTIVVVYAIYAYLHAYRLHWRGTRNANRSAARHKI